MADQDINQLFTATQHTNDLLIASFLYKRSTTSSKVTIEESITTVSTNDQPETSSTSAHYKFNKSGYHSYWCVLRRGQFSYYKDRSERKPMDVIPADQILDFRVSEKDLRLNFYTSRKTYYLRAESSEILQDWSRALQEFFADKRRRASRAEKLPNDDGSGAEASEDLGHDDDDNADDDDEFNNNDKSDTYDDNDELDSEIDNENHSNENENENENDDDFEMVSEVRPETEKIHSADSRVFPVPDEDREFYAIYNPEQNPPRLIQESVLYCRVKKRLGRKTWKKVAAHLDSNCLRIASLSSGKTYRDIELAEVVDCIEDESRRCFTGFDVITYDERLKFRALTEQDTIDWIMNLKSCVLARKKLGQLKPTLIRSE
ncbi:LANO_0G10682g1_1 [Lachancea nothofagi CBS 11611]|uniref:LANO_0G10682g1_1 n=1 Tax=Lachancea nothofagi CBS 11611 TaxID=1266666 RepID=A0A1G4KJ57_9SACH|nr:LANO_0G10682g1_1 [Lachancea nothofagi CBS 11611]